MVFVLFYLDNCIFEGFNGLPTPNNRFIPSISVKIPNIKYL